MAKVKQSYKCHIHIKTYFIQTFSFLTISPKYKYIKALSDNVKANTISRYKISYSRFISDNFAGKDIKSLSKSDLKTYTQDVVTRLNPTKKAFLSYKSVLNLAFGYALENGLTTDNPVISVHNNRYYKSCKIAPPKPEQKILSEHEINLVRTEIRKMMPHTRYKGYFVI